MKNAKEIIKKVIRTMIIFLWKFFAPALMLLDFEVKFAQALCGDPIEYSLPVVIINVIFSFIIASIWYMYVTNKKKED